MKINALYLLIFLLGGEILFAQSKIIGTVIDKSNKKSIAGATIYLSDLKKGTVTNIEGNYSIENIPNGTYLFEINYIGYKNIIQKIKIVGGLITHNFELAESPTELNEVIITGVTRSTEIKLSPVIIKQINLEKMSQSGSTNLIDALKNIPGINQITTGASVSKPIIRGLGYNRVISLVDGVKQEGQQWGDEHGIEIDEYNVDRIEIIKGPGSLLYGSDGIAGVINFISPKAPAAGHINTKLATNYQSNNNLLAYSLSNAGNKNNIQWLARLTQKVAGNYQNIADGKVLNSGFKEINGSAFLGINKNWGYSHLNFASYNTNLGLVEGERDNLGRFTYEKLQNDGSVTSQSASENDLSGFKIGIPNQKINHIRISNNNYFKLKKGSINLDLGFQNNKRKEFGSIISPKIPDIFFDLNTTNYNIRYNIDQINGWESSIGIGGMAQNNKNKGFEFIIPEYNLFDIGSFIFIQKTFKERFTIAGGLRIDNRNIHSQKLEINDPSSVITTPKVKFNELNKNYKSISGSIGISNKLTEVSTIKLNLSRGFRAPNIAEIASNGQHEGTFRYEIGNENLKPEYSHQIDVGYFLNADHVTFEFTPFFNSISNYIFVQKTENTDIVDLEEDSSVFEFMQGQAQLFGGEVYLDIHPHPLDWLHIENSFSFVNALQKNAPDSLKYLPFIPSPKYRLELKSEFQKINKSISNVYFRLALDHFFAQNRYFKAFNTETATPSYSILGAGAGATLSLFGKAEFLNIIFNVDNLTNTIYQNHLNRLKYAPENQLTGRNGVFNMGRNFSLKMLINI